MVESVIDWKTGPRIRKDQRISGPYEIHLGPDLTSSDEHLEMSWDGTPSTPFL